MATRFPPDIDPAPRAGLHPTVPQYAALGADVLFLLRSQFTVADCKEFVRHTRAVDQRLWMGVHIPHVFRRSLQRRDIPLWHRGDSPLDDRCRGGIGLYAIADLSLCRSAAGDACLPAGADE